METIILFAPLVGALIAGFGWRVIGETGAQYVTTGLLFLAAFLSWIVFLGHDGETEIITLFRWIDSGTFAADWAIRVDRLTAIMLVVINSVSALVHLYSFGYMAHDDNFREGEHYKARFFAYLSLFTFAMLMLVTAENLVQMFFGWEGVGLASYLLIGFYYRKPTANAAAIKAFVVNRVGDFGFALGIFSIFLAFDSIEFSTIFAEVPNEADSTIRFLWRDWATLEIIAFLLFIGAMGKSAQLILHTWLPDAMEGPTPVSALIHAATMVTAGVFLVCRMSPIMEFAPTATTFITFLGAMTAFFAATVGLVQNDIKRVIAYSTCSQLGYMFVAAGVGAYPVAMFHLFTHAFFKAMLFLGAGSVIHGMHHEQDMRNYGGLKDKLPKTFWAMMIGTLAITGVGIPLLYIGFPVGFAGFISKDAIIESAYAGQNSMAGFAFVMLVIAALMTSFYSWRLMFLTFYGEARGDKHTHEHAHESPNVMLAPLAVLAVGAIFAGMIWYKPFFGDHHKVEKWFGISKGEEHAQVLYLPGAAHAAGSADEKDDHGEAKVTPPPGTGAIYFAPDNHIIDDAHHVPKWVKVSPFVVMLLGFGLALSMYIRSFPVWVKPAIGAVTAVTLLVAAVPWWIALGLGALVFGLLSVIPFGFNEVLARNQAPLYRFLLNKWYVDEIYDAVFVKPAMWVGRFLWKKGDGATIDGGINGLAMGIIPFFTRVVGRAQSGYVFHYAFAMVLGIAILITWMTLSGGAE